MDKKTILSTIACVVIVAGMMVAWWYFRETEERAVLEGSVVGIALGNRAVHVIDANGRVWHWGQVLDGRLMSGFEIDLSPIPVNLAAPARYVNAFGSGNLSGSRGHAMAITVCNNLYGWGWNDFGQLGDGSFANRFDPIRIMENVKSVVVGIHHTMAITYDGVLWAWGCKMRGGTLRNYSINTMSPHPRKIMDDVIAISGGHSSNLALRADGSLWGFGHVFALGVGWAASGELLRSPHEDHADLMQMHPVKIMENVIDMASGFAFSMVITADNALWVMGGNNMGQLGTGDYNDAPYPILLMENVVSISAAGTSAAAVTADGGLYTWGVNTSGRLGNGTTANRNTPERILEDTQKIFARALNMIAIMQNGEIMAWGNNQHGQITGRRAASSFYAPQPLLGGSVFFEKIP
ncbi:MAG: hypothetical protein FWB71_01990 [Defluviitaleaceae bacterium]|nr:hypothetical protein [Defluviitaleaceae bacterium]